MKKRREPRNQRSTARQKASQRFEASKWFLDRRWVRLSMQLVSGAVIVGFIACAIAYLRFARMIDRELEAGAFSRTTEIYSAGRPIAAGDALTRQYAVERLRRSGYSTSRHNPIGFFVEHDNAIEVHPGMDAHYSAGPFRIEFSGSKIARIRSLKDGGDRTQVMLGPQFIASVSGDRERRTPVRYVEIPTALVNAVVSVEDKRFFKHGGFDPLRIAKAAYVDVVEGRKEQGASTLSMQLARSLWLSRDKHWRRKLSELMITLHLEHKLTKQQIFEYYANQVYLGRRGTFSIQGFGEASRAYFGKDLSQIDVPEAALLAGMIQRPSYYNPVRYPERARDRRNRVLNMMRENGLLTEQEYRKAVDTPLRIFERPLDQWSAPYFMALAQDELQEKVRGTNKQHKYVITTLDSDLQQAAEEAVRTGMENVDRQLRGRRGIEPGQPQVALVAVDPRTGDIKALVGGRNYVSSQLNHAVCQRQPGSVFKPFVYTAALATGLGGGPRIFTAATILHDEPATFYFNRKIYEPGNYHEHYMGQVTLRRALAHSLNSATVSLAEQVGYERVVSVARRAGLNDRIQATPAVALGAYETTPLEIAAAYTMFANQGRRVTPTTIAEVRAADGTLIYRHTPESQAALDPRVNYLMVDLLQEVLRSGTGAGVRGRGFTLPAGGKTGTSRDGWFAGFTSELVCVVWVGFDDNRELNLEGSRSALPIWADFMKRAARFRPYQNAKAFAQPPGIVSVPVCEKTGRHVERFIAGTAPGSSDCGGTSTPTRDSTLSRERIQAGPRRQPGRDTAEPQQTEPRQTEPRQAAPQQVEPQQREPQPIEVRPLKPQPLETQPVESDDTVIGFPEWR